MSVWDIANPGLPNALGTHGLGRVQLMSARAGINGSGEHETGGKPAWASPMVTQAAYAAASTFGCCSR